MAETVRMETAAGGGWQWGGGERWYIKVKRKENTASYAEPPKKKKKKGDGQDSIEGKESTNNGAVRPTARSISSGNSSGGDSGGSSSRAVEVLFLYYLEPWQGRHDGGGAGNPIWGCEGSSAGETAGERSWGGLRTKVKDQALTDGRVRMRWQDPGTQKRASRIAEDMGCLSKAW